MTSGSTGTDASERAAVFLLFGVCAVVPFTGALPFVVAGPPEAEAGAGGAGPGGGGLVGRCGTAAVVDIDWCVCETALDAAADMVEREYAVTCVEGLAGTVAGETGCTERVSYAPSSELFSGRFLRLTAAGEGIQQKRASLLKSR